MRRPSKVLTLSVLCATTSLLTGCAAHARRETAVAPTPAAVDSIGTRLVQLELERVRQSNVQRQQRPEGALIDPDVEISDLYTRLRALPNGGSAEREMRGRVLAALGIRAVNVKKDLGNARQFYTDAYPLIRDLRDEVRRIDERLSELRAAVEPSGRPPATRQASSPR